MKVFTILGLLLTLLCPAIAVGATLTLRAVPDHIGRGDLVAVDVVVDTLRAVNVFSGEVSYSRNLEPVAVSDGSSIVSMWLERPTVQSLTFSGLVPGGYVGQGGMLFRILLRANEAGEANVSILNPQLLQNDGQGSPEPLLQVPLRLVVAPQPVESFTDAADTEAPESFAPMLTLLDGQSYLVFTATDKSSGIDHYEVGESRFFMPRTFARAESLYLLRDDTTDVYVKAVDRAGNERMASYPHRRLLHPHEYYIVGVLLILLFIGLYVRSKNKV